MSYLRDFMSMAMYSKSPFHVHRNRHENPVGSALADLVARPGVVDLRIALLVGDRVVEADDAEFLVDLLHGHRVVRAADVGVGAGALDGQLVVVAPDIERFPVRAIEFGCRPDGAVVAGISDLDLAALRT